MWRLVLTVTLLCCGSEASVTCKNENNGQVDWYILYKAPRQAPLTGLEYLYMDSTGVRKMDPQQPNYKPIDHPDGVLAHTLRPLFTPTRSMPLNFGFISYSDQPPGCSADDKFGHSKGVLMVDKTGTGVWLLHSTPQFPYDRDQNNFWPPTGASNAQTFICVPLRPVHNHSEPAVHLSCVHMCPCAGTHLKYIRAFPFEHDIPLDFHQELRDVQNWVHPVPSDSFQSLTSNLSLPLHSIAKKRPEDDDGGDLYVTLTNRIESHLLVQTWGCQASRAHSFCGPNNHKVENINSVKTPLGNWKATVDHSKWCVANNPGKPWTCIADVNRAQTQYKRRGGALCINNAAIKKTHSWVL
ncbi:hypothetical protein Q5P01_024059 [Channa striata]|uniref:Deoxyribonuclease-2-alpha n=1 Tax=Channa striata TaxID=64152 RepID=A0AA88IKQ7_CHASR|nr:hypothetical protein Q5P01_024059 [Channa striata]